MYRDEKRTITDTAASVRLKKKVMKYTTTQINRNFKIKVYGMYNGKKVNTLVGVRGFLEMVADIELSNRLLDRAFGTMKDKEVCKLRRGIKFTFYCI